jgi:hypothetical protein
VFLSISLSVAERNEGILRGGTLDLVEGKGKT